MNQTNCAQETAVLEAVRSGEWKDSLRTHAAECAVCREVVEASRWMQTLAQSPQGSFALPDPELLWRRARLHETLTARQAEAERAHRTIEWAETAPLLAASVGLAGWAAWNWQIVQTTVIWLLTGISQAGARVWAQGWAQLWPQLGSPQAWIAAYDGASATPTFVSLAVPLFFVAMIVAYPILTEE